MTINCKGKLIDLTNPKVMGILNLTPDSFYDGGKYNNERDILEQVEKMLSWGATFIDLGAYSTRPGADEISTDEELKRLLPVLELVLNKFPDALVSIDTFKSKVAKEALERGAALINDISAGLLDEAMMEVIAEYHVPYIMMHMRGNPKTMQEQIFYEDLLQEIMFYFSERLSVARSKGIIDVLIDPGFGFSKTLEQNYELLRNLDLLTMTDRPILAGLSRKSMIYKLLGTDAQHALNGTTALNMLALEKGASILRVHDVAEAMECIKIYKQLTA
ncbi:MULTISPECIES: dihydropteroate synthase [Maribacter]|uniref:Dihydropteroate synthase n=1 Tax=Maribacter flavus TaxID=1658664 RepID=A0A5B2TWG0_9FLAO|nr:MULTISPECIES: dihydropteroate synthase [Maribacter]KAA2218308.1 dihydropteroate synthase [Maribacter flavus]MDC6405002.1 dihydropteroate synthase [Maribacter sp. PR66]MEE1972416.1 dihydropteroate synthase [Maribacter flavus]